MPSTLEMPICESELAFEGAFPLAGAWCEWVTNSPQVAAIFETLPCPPGAARARPFTLQVSTGGNGGADRHPHFRGLNHIVAGSFVGSDIFVFDLLRRHVSAMLPESCAGNARFWKRDVLPVTIGVMGAALGTVPLHAACLRWKRAGVIITGPSGAGKSTLAVALAQAGLGFLSDDWTYLSVEEDQLIAHGGAASVKLLPDAACRFPFLSRYVPRISMNGELAYEVDAEEIPGLATASSCEPRCLLFLGRESTEPTGFTPLPADRVRAGLEANLERLPGMERLARNRAEVLDRVSALPCWRFNYRGNPRMGVRRILEFLSSEIRLAGAFE